GGDGGRRDHTETQRNGDSLDLVCTMSPLLRFSVLCRSLRLLRYHLAAIVIVTSACSNGPEPQPIATLSAVHPEPECAAVQALEERVRPTDDATSRHSPH